MRNTSEGYLPLADRCILRLSLRSETWEVVQKEGGLQMTGSAAIVYRRILAAGGPLPIPSRSGAKPGR